jgi:hypothetical protein
MAPPPAPVGAGVSARRLSVTMAMPPALKQPQMMKHKVKKANTNVLAVDLSTLASDAELVAGDAFFCGSCRAVFSSHSKVESNGMWLCEFCNHSNYAGQLEDEEKPKAETVEFLLEPAPAQSAGDLNSQLVIFVVDISGSMCSSTAVPGNFKLKGTNNVPNLEAGDDRHQHFPGSDRNVTYVSRLQCVQAAIESQLEMMANQTPNARVALVTFNRDVTIYGDCISTSSPIVVSGDKLNSYEQLVAIGEQNKTFKPISETRTKLAQTLMKLSEDGPTALGPAIAISLGMAKGSYGARIVLATDGLSNTGVGAMDQADLLHEAQEYYDKLSVVALGQSSTVNIVGIRGGDSVRMGMLGKMSDVTQGEVNLVDPLNIVSEFASMLQAKIVATNVNVKLLLHKGLALVNVDASKLIPGVLNAAGAPIPPSSVVSMDVDGDNSNKQSSVEQAVGNAYEDSELTFEYEVQSAAKLDALFLERAKALGLEGDLPADAKQLTFQVQITYSKLDGSKCIRTITRTQLMTHDRQEVEKTAKAGLLGAHAWGRSARLAEQGHYEAAMVNNMQMGQMFARAPVNSKQSAQYAEGTSNFNAQLRSGLSKRSRVEEQQQQQLFSAPPPAAAYGSAPQPQQPQQQAYGSSMNDDDDDTATSILQFKANRKAKKNIDRD